METNLNTFLEVLLGGFRLIKGIKGFIFVPRNITSFGR